MSETVTNAFSKLTTFDWGVVFAGLGLIAALEIAKPQPAALSRSDQAFVDWGKDASGFGAFARGQKGAFGWVSGRGTQSVAVEDALAYCQAGGETCRITAMHDTSVYNPILKRNITPTMSRHFDAYLRKPSSRAIALSEDGSIGYWSGASSVETAITNALKTCAHYQNQKDRPDFLTDRPCKIVHMSP